MCRLINKNNHLEVNHQQLMEVNGCNAKIHQPTLKKGSGLNKTWV